ncbi:MAG: right-handed parallel beta-helix repeat-containing protein [Deltaproteobacteria bacterium]|nr:right-handed parallel beta-helix repeat-containing protein [Deltaproteobacteria bacterium]
MDETTVGSPQRRRPIALLLALCLANCHCNGDTTARPCDTNDDCDPGQVCLDGRCRALGDGGDSADGSDVDDDGDAGDVGDAEADGDSGPFCGNGVVEPGEDCDGNCPESCDDDDPCTIDSGTVSPETCSIDCTHEPITVCAPGDGCCAPGCDRTSDSDCPYHVDATLGDDGNDGLTPETAWRTAARVGEEPLAPGDRVAFKRGEVWHEPLLLTASGTEELPIVIQSYGEADAPPFFVPTRPVTGWTAEADGVFSAPLDAEPLLVVTDGERLTVAHHPNEGYLYVDEDSTALDSFVDNDLASSGAGDVVGALILMRANRWDLLAQRVTGFAAPTVTLEGPLPGDASIGTNEGYLLTDRLWMVDGPGEWFYDATGGRLYLRLAGDAEPSGSAVEAATDDDGIRLQGDHVTLDALGVRHTGRSGIHVRGNEGIVVRNCRIESVGYHGIYVNWPPAGAEVLLEGNTVVDAYFSGIMVNADAEVAQHVVVRGNTVEDTGAAFPLVGRTSPAAGHGWGFGMGLHLRGSGVEAHENTVRSAGYSCLVAGGTGLSIRHNLLERCCLLFDDGGGIYMGGSGHQVVGNTIIDSLGNPEGTPSFFTTGSTAAQGIYPDDRSHDIVIEDNTVVNADWGLQLHNTYNDRIRRNTFYASRKSGIMISEDSIVGVPGFVHDNVIEDNVVFVVGETYAVRESHGLESTVDFAAYDDNTYWHEQDRAPFMRSTLSGGQVEYTFDRWRDATGQDAASVNLASTYVVVPLAGRPTGPSNLISNGTFDADTAGWTSWPGAVGVAWNADGGLTAGCLSATAVGAGSGALVSSPSFPVTADQGYLLRFSLRAETAQSVRAIVRHNDTPWESLGLYRAVDYGPTRTDYALAFVATGTQTGRLDLTSNSDFAFFLDDVDFREADVRVNDRDDDARILVNATNTPFDVDLGAATYCDLEDHEVSGIVVIPAYGSRILVACRCNNDAVCNNHETAATCPLDCG